MMTSRFKWLTPILVLSLLVMTVLPSVSCTEGQILYLLFWSVKCGIEVYLGGEQLGTLEFAKEWGVCVLPGVTTVAMQTLGFKIPGEVLAASASDVGFQLRAGQTTDIPDMEVTYKGVLAPDSRCEINLYYPPELITESSTRLSGATVKQPPLMGSIVVETSSEPFKPRPLINPSITCEPSSFIAMLQPDTAWSTTMRIVNQGSAVLTYNVTDTLTEAIPVELIYDDGTADGAAWVEGGSPDRDAVRFTPASYPASLKTARIRLWPNSPDSDHEQFAIEVYDDDGPGGAPGSLLGTVYDTAMNWDWWDVDISALGITIGSGDFYIAYCQLTGCPDCEVVSRDVDYPYYGRSWSKCEACSSWVQHTSENFMIRCLIGIPQDCPWLKENPKSGSVDPYSWNYVTVAIDASGLAPAEYDAEIRVFSNDPQNSPITVPLTLLVNRPPIASSNPSPENHCDYADTTTDLSWTGGDPDAGDTVTYDVYFGTSATPPLVSEGQSAASYDPGTLSDATKYYWRIVATDNHGASTDGPVWDFTTSHTGFNPHFTMDKVEVAVGEVVTFDPTSTVGGTMAGNTYKRARWDFDGDLNWDEDSYVTGKDPLDLATWAYSEEGEYYPCLEITDFSDPVIVHEECMVDLYSIVVGAGVTRINWDLPYGLDADAAAVNIWTYPSYGVAVTLADVDATMPNGLLIWYYGGPGRGWRFYKKGWGAVNTLETLIPGKGYIGIVPATSVWEIPQG